MKQHGAPIIDYCIKLRSIYDELESTCIVVTSKPSIKNLLGIVSFQKPWFLDSGASMIGTISFLSNIHTISPCSIELPNGDRTLVV